MMVVDHSRIAQLSSALALYAALVVTASAAPAQAPEATPGPGWAQHGTPTLDTLAEPNCEPYAPRPTGPLVAGYRSEDLLEPGLALHLPAPERSRNDLSLLSARNDPAQLCIFRKANAELVAHDSKRVVFLGDSITQNWLRADPGLFGPSVVNRGIGGQTTSQMLLRFRQDVIDLHPVAVHIMAGTNDLQNPARTALTTANLMSMAELARAHGIKVIFASIPPVADFWTQPGVESGPKVVVLNKWLREYARRNGYAYVDYYALLVDDKQGLRKDLGNEGLHPNRTGYAAMRPLALATIAAAQR